MGKKKHKKNSDTDQIVKLALATAILTLLSQIITIVQKLINWIANS